MNEFSTAGTKLKINGTAITGMTSYPDMGTEPAKIDVTSMDDTVNKRYIDGLMDVSSMVFEFNNDTENIKIAKSSENAKNNEYELDLPDGSKFTWNGSHKAYASGGSVGNPTKFKISCTINSEIEFTEGTVVGS